MSNVTTTWKFSSLDAIADHLEFKATNDRESQKKHSPRSQLGISFREKAAANESLAYLLRHTKLEP